VATVSLGADGTASAQVGPFHTVGDHQVTAHYAGDDNTSGSGGAAQVEVRKGKPSITVSRNPGKVIAQKTRAVLDVVLSAPGQVVTGDVKVSGAPGGDLVKSLSGGEVSFKLPVFKKAGEVTLKVIYLGSDDNERVVKEISFTVQKAQKRH